MPQAEFREFYQRVLSFDDAEMDRLMASAASPLPYAFRITNCPEAGIIRKRLSQFPLCKPVEYLPDVYSFEAGEKNEERKRFMEFIVSQTDTGAIQRQEVVSMLPHLALDVRPDSRVLETCAAPGSKTKQLLETVGERGLLVSNDKSPGRVNVLISEASKKASPSFVVTMGDASQMPITRAKFDRICCDVPCSADGTTRKNPNVLADWSLAQAQGLCNLQRRILMRALEQLEEGGLLSYSTCSLNPIENENVIRQILETGEYELLDVRDRITRVPGAQESMTVRPGIVKFSEGAVVYDCPELSRCIRILPHDNNTGGFFIVVLRKKHIPTTETAKDESKPVVAKAESKSAAAKDEETEKRQLEKGMIGKSLFLAPDDKVEDAMNQACSDRELPPGACFVSLTKRFKTLYYLSQTARDFISTNPRMRIAHAGMKAFALNDIEETPTYRPKTPFMRLVSSKTHHVGTKEDLKLLIASPTVSAALLSFSPAGFFNLGFDFADLIFYGSCRHDKVLLYVDSQHRKALSALYLREESPTEAN